MKTKLKVENGKAVLYRIREYDYSPDYEAEESIIICDNCGGLFFGNWTENAIKEVSPQEHICVHCRDKTV